MSDRLASSSGGSTSSAWSPGRGGSGTIQRSRRQPEEDVLGFFDYRKGVRFLPHVSIRRRRRGEPGPENDACNPAPDLVAGRGKPRVSSARSLTPVQAILLGLLLAGLGAAMVVFGVLGALVVGLYVSVPVCFVLIFIHLARNRPGKGPPLRRRSD